MAQTDLVAILEHSWRSGQREAGTLSPREENLAIERIASLTQVPRHLVRNILVVGPENAAIRKFAREKSFGYLQNVSGYGDACHKAYVRQKELPDAPDTFVFHLLDGTIAVDAIAPFLEARDPHCELGIARHLPRLPRWAAEMPLLGEKMQEFRLLVGLLPLRWIRTEALTALGMSDRGDGWDAEMVIRSRRIELSLQVVDVETQHLHVRSVSVAKKVRQRALGVYHLLRHTTLR